MFYLTPAAYISLRSKFILVFLIEFKIMIVHKPFTTAPPEWYTMGWLRTHKWIILSFLQLCCHLYQKEWLKYELEQIFINKGIRTGVRSSERYNRWSRMLYLRLVEPDFLFPEKRCLGLRSNTCLSDSPFLPCLFMPFCEFFIMPFTFFNIWGRKIKDLVFNFMLFD